MNKKVLIFSFAYYPYVGGAEVAIKEITDRLRDFQFDLITFDLGGQKKEEHIGNVNVHRISASSKFFYPILSFFKAISLHWKNQYDVEWAMMANTGFAALFLKIFFPKINFILTIQEGDPIDQIKRRIWFVYPIYKWIFRMADHITAISNYLAGFSREMGSRMVSVIPNGVDLKNFRPKDTQVNLDNSEIKIITTGRLVKKNAVSDIIKALKFLPDSVKFLSVGSGPDKSMLEKLIALHNLENRVTLLPYADHVHLAELLAQAQIFIRPSLSEGLGISFLEAMAMGLPVIATQVGGIPDFLFDGETGLFCEVGNPKSIAERVIHLMNNPEIYKKISKNSQRLVREKYDWEMIAKKFGEIFLGKF